MTYDEQVFEYKNTGNEAIFTEIFKNYKALVKSIVWKFSGSAKKIGIDVKDLEQEAWIAFYEAIKTFDKIENGAKFATYSYIVIKYRLINLLKKEKKQSYQSLNSELCDNWTLEDSVGGEDIYEYMKSDDEKRNEVLKKDLYFVLDTLFPKINTTDFSFISSLELMNVLNNGISVRDILIKHYGLEGVAYSTSDLAAEIGVSKQCIIEMENGALKHIRNSDIGEALMVKYLYLRIEQWELEKARISQLSLPEVKLKSNEAIDDILLNILKSTNINQEGR